MKMSHPLEATSCSATQTFLTFMEPEGSLQYSQQPANGHYPEPNQ
jgi:hypothetical protein